MTQSEKAARAAGETAAERIGDKPMCNDPIMQGLIVEARSESGRARNRRLMMAWLRGRGWDNLIQQ